jgi:hypothetical protein
VPGDEDSAVIGVLHRVTRERLDRVHSRLFGHSVLADVTRVLHDPLDASTGADAIEAAVGATLRRELFRGDPAGVQAAATAAAKRVSAMLARRLSHPRTLVTNRPVADTWRSWTLHFGGQADAPWLATATFLADAYGEFGSRGWRRRGGEFVAAQSAGWWWPHLRFVLVSDRPTLVRTESDSDSPGRLHCADGPAIEWRDGFRLFFWHGTRVPEWVIDGPTVAAIAAEPNVEVRRCAIEAMGWDTYITRAGLRLVDRATDPGNVGCELRLYDLPPAVWGAPSRVLLVSNGSAERDGTRRRYGLPVPPDAAGAVDAAAWTYGLTSEQYARVARRT